VFLITVVTTFFQKETTVNRRVVSSSLTCGANLYNELRAPFLVPVSSFCDVECDETRQSGVN